MEQRLEAKLQRLMATMRGMVAKETRRPHMEIPEFHGDEGPAEFLAWLATIDRFMESDGVPEDARVQLVAAKLRKEAYTWWHDLKATRKRSGKSKVVTWEKMRRLLRARFLPYNFQHESHPKLMEKRRAHQVFDEIPKKEPARQRPPPAPVKHFNRGNASFGRIREQATCRTSYDDCSRRGFGVVGFNINRQPTHHPKRPLAPQRHRTPACDNHGGNKLAKLDHAGRGRPTAILIPPHIQHEDESVKGKEDDVSCNPIEPPPIEGEMEDPSTIAPGEEIDLGLLEPMIGGIEAKCEEGAIFFTLAMEHEVEPPHVPLPIKAAPIGNVIIEAPPPHVPLMMETAEAMMRRIPLVDAHHVFDVLPTKDVPQVSAYQVFEELPKEDIGVGHLSSSYQDPFLPPSFNKEDPLMLEPSPIDSFTKVVIGNLKAGARKIIVDHPMATLEEIDPPFWSTYEGLGILRKELYQPNPVKAAFGAYQSSTPQVAPRSFVFDGGTCLRSHEAHRRPVFAGGTCVMPYLAPRRLVFDGGTNWALADEDAEPTRLVFDPGGDVQNSRTNSFQPGENDAAWNPRPQARISPNWAL